MSKRSELAVKLRNPTFGRDSGEVVSSLVPGDLLESTGNLDLDEAAFVALGVSLGLRPANLARLFVLLGDSSVVRGGRGETGEGELGRASGDFFREEGEGGDEVNLGGTAERRERLVNSKTTGKEKREAYEATAKRERSLSGHHSTP